jgi:hypothetical protein
MRLRQARLANACDSEVWSRSRTHFRVDRRSPRYCHVTFDHPPINTITATTVGRRAYPERPKPRLVIP